MKKIVYISLVMIILFFLLAGEAWATPPGGEPFGNLAGTVAALEASTVVLEAQVAALMELLQHFSREGNDIYTTGANLHIRNGFDATDVIYYVDNIMAKKAKIQKIVRIKNCPMMQ